MGQKSRWTLPETVHPDGYRRFVICVPDERFYIAAFEGLLIELTYSKNWQRDSGLTAAAVSRVWQDVLASATCDEECATIIDDLEYQMSICEQLRFHNGKLQGYCCGEWVDITGQPAQGTDGPGQPNDGTQPAPGACTVYSGKFNASGQWLLPTVVNAGDTLSFSNVKGAASDGTLHWYCNDGQVFFGGACVGSKSLNGADPAPLIAHMAIVALIGTVYYDISAGVITVPGGIANEQVILQANDSSLAGDSGDYTFDVTYCNNAVPEWTSVMQFTLSPYAFAVVPADGGGVWTPGAGWDAQDTTIGGNCYKSIAIKKIFTAATLTSIKFEAAIALGTASGSVSQQIVWYNPARTVLQTVANSAGSDIPILWTGSQLMDNFELNGAVGFVGGACGAAGGSERVFKLTVTGTGPKPPEFP